ncbi:MAG: hypothetical protein Q4D61_00870 [Cardiobacteriaceae bacterium]|nr:hypothetical protein [Cardiobacteriaceae bacterium]
MSAAGTALFTLLGAWLAMMLGDWFFPWLVLPDLVLLAWIALVFAFAAVPLWPAVAFVSVLLDVSADVPLGLHGLAYALCAFLLLPGMRRLRLSSGVEQLTVIAFISVCAALVKGILLYVLVDMPMPVGWPLGVFVQMLLWPFARALGEALMRPHLPRDES